MKINEEGLGLIKSFEQCRLMTYDDATGKPVGMGQRVKGVLTIGWGHTGHLTPGQQITQEQADAWLIEDVGKAESEVTRLVKVALTSNQFSALVSFEYNCGRLGDTGDGRPSTLLVLLNQRNYLKAADQFLRWVKDQNPATGKLEIKAGLVRRRADERALFLKPETL